MNPHERALHYMKGYYCGAGCKIIPPDLAADEDFNSGWEHGLRDRKAAAEKAAQRYGVTFSKVHTV